MEKETFAIKWTLDRLRYYLLCREFTLVTDHKPLRWMASAKDTNARVTRWFLALQAWIEDDPGLHPGVKVCGVPILRGDVIDGVYHRCPPAGARERPWPGPHQADEGLHREQGQPAPTLYQPLGPSEDPTLPRLSENVCLIYQLFDLLCVE